MSLNRSQRNKRRLEKERLRVSETGETIPKSIPFDSVVSILTPGKDAQIESELNKDETPADALFDAPLVPDATASAFRPPYGIIRRAESSIAEFSAGSYFPVDMPLAQIQDEINRQGYKTGPQESCIAAWWLLTASDPNGKPDLSKRLAGAKLVELMVRSNQRRIIIESRHNPFLDGNSLPPPSSEPFHPLDDEMPAQAIVERMPTMPEIVQELIRGQHKPRFLIDRGKSPADLDALGIRGERQPGEMDSQAPPA